MFIDNSYCASDCTNSNCLRNKNNQKNGAPSVMFNYTDFSQNCSYYIPKEPEKKTIDLSVLEGEKTLMVFSEPVEFHSSKTYLGFLKTVGNDSVHGLFYNDQDSIHYKKCKVKEGYWNFWHGNDGCPLPIGFGVALQLRGWDAPMVHDYYLVAQWKHKNNKLDVIGYRIIELMEDFKYYWED